MFIITVIGLAVSLIEVKYFVYGLSGDQPKSVTLQQRNFEPPKKFLSEVTFGLKFSNSGLVHKLSLETANLNSNGNIAGKKLKKREVSSDDVEEEYEYNYEEFKKEYYDENKIRVPVTTTWSDEGDLKKTAKQKKKPFDQKMENYCSVFLYVRIRVFSCLRHAIVHDEPELKSRCVHVFLFWFLVYLTLAIYLWCTEGWCCCCFSWMCWCCRPYAVMRQAKDILATRPPGAGTAAGLRVSGRERKYYSQLEEALYY